MKLRFYLALYIAKLSIPALKITKHNGTDFPGFLALKICPDFIKYIGRPKQIVTVTGTDGKTTVTNLCYDIMSQTGKKVLSNNFGSNIKSGIATVLLKGVDIFNHSTYDMGIIEVDERSSMVIYPYLEPDYIIVTNLFRDSIMRNAHPEYIRSFITNAIPEKTKLILNGDDLISCEISPNNKRVYYGISKCDNNNTECINLINDKQICPKCHNKLIYDYRHYHHIGKAHCSHCDFKSPELSYEVIDITKDSMTVLENGVEYKYNLISDKLFDIYNMISAISLARELGLKHEQIIEYMNKSCITKTRYNETDVNGCKIIMQMAKDMNALACSRVFDYLGHQDGDIELFLMMSNRLDEVEWSENTCWMYDCDFEFLNSKNIKHIVAAGARCKDFRLRLNLAGYPDENIDCVFDDKEAIKSLHLKKGSKVYMLYGASGGDIDYAFNIKDLIVARAKEVTK